jgi:DNA-binding response OmpR family regulator
VSERSTSPPTVLLVDDDPLTLAGLVRTLQSESYFVLTAPNAEGAFSVLTQRPVDVIVADEMMPGLSGTEFLQRVHQEYPGIGLIMLTAVAYPEVPERKLAMAAVVVLRKPCDPVLFRATVREELRRRPASS